MLEIREKISFTKDRVIVRGKLVSRGRAKRADHILSCKPHIPTALVEAKENSCAVGDQASGQEIVTRAILSNWSKHSSGRHISRLALLTGMK